MLLREVPAIVNATGYVGTVHFASTDPQAVLPSNDSFTASDHGVKTIAVTFKTMGSRTVTINDLANTAMTVTTGAMTVTPGALAKLVFLQQPTTGASGSVMKPGVSVQLFDDFGNLKSDGTNAVSLTSSLAALTLGGTTTVSAVNGVATFANLIVNGGGLGVTLQASAAGVTAVSSAKFNNVVLSNILPAVVAAEIYGPRPNSSTQKAYVKGVYRTLLGRDADSNGMSFWLGQLSGGSARSSIITAFWNSPENRGREVDT
jgi:hypothetical protein